MAKKIKNQGDEQLANVEETLVQSEQWLEKNRNPLLITVGVIVLVVLGIFAVKKFWHEPRVEEGKLAMALCQEYFEADSFRVALEGDGMECDGFLGVIDQYSMTPSADLAKTYAGICYYRLGEYQEAIDYLKKGNAQGLNAEPVVAQLIGDAYVELGQYEDAIDAFKKAASFDNIFITPSSLLKLGNVYKELDRKEDAKAAYQRIIDEFPESMEAYEVEKYLAQVR